MASPRDIEFTASMLDVQRFHRTPMGPLMSSRRYELFRHGTKPVDAAGSTRRQLWPGQSRLLTGRVIGCGAEGIAVLVPSADYYEQVMHTTLHSEGVSSRSKEVVKLREVHTDVGRASMMLQTVARELVQGSLATHLRLPFVVGLRRWRLADVSCARPTRREPHHITLPGAQFYDTTDLLSREEATYARQRYVSAATGVAVPHNATSAQVDERYAALRDAALLRYDRLQLPLVVMEQQSAGDTTLRRFIEREHLLLESRWQFLRVQILLVAAAVAHLQREHAWMHGDLQLANVVMWEGTYSRYAPLPRDIASSNLRMRTTGSGVWRAFTQDDLRLAGTGKIYMPRFIDLSRSAIDPVRANRLIPRAVTAERSELFHAHAVAYMDGYSTTADMRRFGLMLCVEIIHAALCARENAPDYTSLQVMEWRAVHVARTLAAGDATWAHFYGAHGDWVRRAVPGEGCTCTAESPTYLVFIYHVSRFEEYMLRVERLARDTKGPAAISTAQFIIERDALRAQSSEMLALATTISNDLNPYLGWMRELAGPAIESDDIRQPARVLDWRILSV